ncbi:peptidylprolyl isomerase [Cohnella lubricantis]|uniref:peptidylprolyl isomerase n=1 Tax=Cohnella lubricantis TaxID=2163172 RepID=A0A841TEI4_9BACL|nr:peptidylprolyl isomerase [Cohnella lubricantis]MBB6679694.1 peptidylprolyl isomerase [Cohnella lubricantis]MBP2119384.1 foldase protein PrsA [Cohnella lubricantis]
MKRTKRRYRPIVLLALMWMLIGETGCDTGTADKASPDPGNAATSPAPSGASGVSGDTSGDSQTVATVGGQSITKQALVDQLLKNYGAQTLRVQMLRIAVELEAEAKGIEITDEEVDQELRRRIEGYDSEDQFYEQAREQLGMDKEEVREDTKYRLQLEQLAIAQVEVPDGDIDRYIEEHPEVFGPRIELQLAHIVVRSESDANEVLQLLENGADFAVLAESLSTDEFTAESGGDMGWIDADDPLTDSALLDAAVSLEVGQVTGPVQTASGYEVVKLAGRNVTAGMSEEAARREARRQLALDRAAPMADLEQLLLDKYGAKVMDEALQH